MASEACNPSDCVMLVKQWVSTNELAQLPLLVLPAARLSALSPANLSPMTRNRLHDEHMKQYRRTAHLLGQEPWNYKKAQEYLTSWCDRNLAGSVDSPLSCDFVLRGRSLDSKTSDSDMSLPPGWKNFTPGMPRTIQVGTVQPEQPGGKRKKLCVKATPEEDPRVVPGGCAGRVKQIKLKGKSKGQIRAKAKQGGSGGCAPGTQSNSASHAQEQVVIPDAP